MGLSLPLIIPLLLISSSLSNPIPLDRAASLDIGLLEQNAQQTTLLTASDKLTCVGSGADRCLVFPIGCVSGVNCTDRLEMRRVNSGTNEGDILISLNLHVPRTAHLLVAVPMPDISNPNSTFLVGCSIDDAAAVVARPDVDGVTEQLPLPWLRMVSVRATSSDLECIVSASAGYIDLPVGDVAVFAGELEPEEEVRQSVRIGGTVLNEDETEVTREHDKSREQVEVDSSIQKITPPLSPEGTPPPLEEHPAGHEPILVSVEDHRQSTTEVPSTTTLRALPPISNKSNKLRFKMLHSSESSSSAERHHLHRHSSAEATHTTHTPVHHETTTVTTTTTVAPEVEETTEVPSTQTPEELTTTVEMEETSTTTVHPSHHHVHHHDSHEQHHTEQPHHSHERATVDKEHGSVRMPPVTTTTTTTTEKPASFEDDKELSEEDKQLLRAVKAGHVKEERSDDDEEENEESTPSDDADGTEHSHKHATMYELTREAANDPIGRRPNEHSHSNHSSSHSHEHRAAVDDDDEEEREEHTTKKAVTRDDDEDEKEEEEEEGDRSSRNGGTTHKMGEKSKHVRSEEADEEEENENEDEDDATYSLSLIIPMIICLAPVIFG